MTNKPAPQAQLGPYEVGTKIGGGGMATVYVARHGKDDDVVAIKVIRDELAHDTQYIHMFLDEAKLLSRLSHPDIIVTRDFGVTPDARFIAMELLLGRSLIDTFERAAEKGTRMPLDLAAFVVMRVAAALGYAHGLHVIHRDVNPTNIFLTYGGRVKLIDFGLAKSASRLAKSGEGIVKGKVPYLSPEQIEEKPFDHRADIYSLGATLWEVTTSRRLFKRDSDVATILAIKAQDIPDPRTFVEGIYPDALWKIVKRALERNADDRYASATEMGHDLEAFLAKSGRKTDMNALLAAWLDELFPGERAKQEAWLAMVSAPQRKPSAATMPPPAPVAQVPVRKEGDKTATTAPVVATKNRYPLNAVLTMLGMIGFFALLTLVFGRC